MGDHQEISQLITELVVGAAKSVPIGAQIKEVKIHLSTKHFILADAWIRGEEMLWHADDTKKIGGEGQARPLPPNAVDNWVLNFYGVRVIIWNTYYTEEHSFYTVEWKKNIFPLQA